MALKPEDMDFISNFNTFWAVFLGAILATIGGFGATQAEWILERKRRERNAAIFFGDRICRLPAQPFANHVELLRNAACVLSDSGDALEEAGALRVPCLKIGLESSITAPVDSHPPAGGNPASATRAVWTCGFVGGVRDDVSELPDGRAGARIAGHLCLWLAAAGRIRTHRVTEKMPTNTDNAGPTPLLRDRHRGFPE